MADRAAAARERRAQPGVEQQWRIDAVGQGPDVLERVLEVATDLLEQRLRLGGFRPSEFPGDPKVHRQRDEPLLRPVVDVPFDAPSLRVCRGNDPSSRGAQLRRLPPKLVERRLKGGVEPEVPKRQADPAAQLGEDVLLILVEWLAVDGALRDDETEQLAGVQDRRDTQLCVLAPGGDAWQPDRRPCEAGDLGAGDHAQLRLRSARASPVGAPGPTRRVPAACPWRSRPPRPTARASARRVSARPSRSSSSGSARESRVSKTRSACSGGPRSPWTRRDTARRQAMSRRHPQHRGRPRRRAPRTRGARSRAPTGHGREPNSTSAKTQRRGLRGTPSMSASTIS